jgi:biopolymer transport protein ExbB
MTGLDHLWASADAVSRTVALVLLLMSVCAWVLIFWKGWLLRRVQHDLARGLPAFWAAADLNAAREQLRQLDRERALLPLVEAAMSTPPSGALEAQVQRATQLTRRLRDTLHQVLAQLQWGQVVLASIGSTAPFVGLLGTVWGIYHALAGMGMEGRLNLERVSGPVGEALIMTAAGLAVAIPAVLAYNIFGKMVGACEAELEGFAHDLREMQLEQAGAAPASPDCSADFETESV